MTLSRYHLAVAVMFVACVSLSYFQANPVQARQQLRDEQLIREARGRSNAAIAAHDPVAMARFWMDDVHVVRSTGAQVAGRERNQQRMAQQFATRPDTIYVRQPSAIDVYLPWARRRSVVTGQPDGLNRTALLIWRERTWPNGVGSTECG